MAMLKPSRAGFGFNRSASITGAFFHGSRVPLAIRDLSGSPLNLVLALRTQHTLCQGSIAQRLPALGWGEQY
jgi:hypothetical protein